MAGGDDDGTRLGRTMILIGTLGVGYLHQVLIVDGGENWTSFWGVLTGAVAACMVVFGVFYKGVGTPGEAEAKAPVAVPLPEGPREPGG